MIRRVIRLSHRRALAAGLLALTVCAVLLTAAPAGASDTDSLQIKLPGHGTGFHSGSAGRLLDVTAMSPGQHASGVLGARNHSGAPATLTLTSNNVVSDENGCTLGERAAPGGCSAGPGQLAGELRFTLSVAPSEHGNYVSKWSGSGAELEHGLRVSARLAAGGTAWVRLSVALPISAGNEVQSDRFGFDLRLTLEGGGTSTSATVGGFGAAPSSGRDGLAMTGFSIALITAAGLLLLACGVLMTAGGPGRRRHRAA